MRVLIVGSMEGQVGEAARIAVKRGAKVAQVPAVDPALDYLRGGKGAELTMVDVTLDVDRLMTGLAAERMSTPVVAFGLSNDTKAAVRAIKAGAREYIPLPPDPELIAAVLEAVAEDTHALIYDDPAMAATVRMAEQVAPSDASVLITGESGTGKEVMARHLHRKSKRKDGPFIAVNCAAIPEALLESELFGHEKGAFTGAVARRIGKFEEANGGTLLLDEISEMDVRLQAKLLRVLQEREIDRVGGKSPVKVDVRILATSNRDLQAEAKTGRFREDLFYRLNVIGLALPPLRSRPSDIARLADHFCKKFSETDGIDARPLAPDTLTMLQSYTWPGNVRELENTMHRAVLIAQGPSIGPDAILLMGEGGATNAPMMAGLGQPDQNSLDTATQDTPGAESQVGRTVAEVERDLIIDTLKHCLGNRTHAANILGISIRTLRNKLRLYTDDGYTVPAPGEGQS